MKALLGRVVFTLITALAGQAAADGGGGSEPARNERRSSDVEQAREAIERGDYPRAAGLLERYTRREPEDADAWNWLGFSRRKAGALEAAFVAYRRALAIDPSHRGAHEYVGEAFLAAGDFASAEKHLADLAALCPAGCEQRADLAAAIARYRAGRP
ncbi:MAG: tetratricopeptide repeat protein [Rhodocyclaceae bacterium]|nr:tetratricopeptide repeat protein [Rhodocyclaceae bacterium]